MKIEIYTHSLTKFCKYLISAFYKKFHKLAGLGLRKLKVLEKSEDIVSALPSQGMVWPVGMAKGQAYLLAEVGTKDENKLKTMTVLFGNHVHLVFPQEF